MPYHINDAGDGRYELLEVRPTVVGVLTNRHIVERFAEFLTAAEEREQEQLADIERFGGREPFPAPDAPVEEPETDLEPVSADAPREPEPVAASPAPEAAPEPNETAKADALARLKETPLQEAMRRLEAGEALALVADETGFHLNKLRGIWANRKKREKQAVSTAEAECATCGKTYHAGATDEGLCARCTRNLGRG